MTRIFLRYHHDEIHDQLQRTTPSSDTMPPKRTIRVEPANPPKAKRAPRGYLGATYDAVTNPENSAVVTSVALFGVGIPFRDVHSLAFRAWVY
jgi:hypothetical protein